MNYLDLSNLGGLPFTQDRLDFLQQSYLAAFGAIAKLCGDKVILTGVVSDGVNVTDGWIAYNGELIPFIGGAIAAQVKINTVAVPFTFGDATIHDVQFTKTATLVLVGDFDFTDLVPLLTLQNTWKKDDIRQCVKDAAYEAANFDAVTGIGMNAEIGWRKLSSVNANAAGAVMVNKKDADADFGVVTNFGGEKKHTLAGNEQGKITAAAMVDDIGGGGANAIARIKINGVEVPRDGAANQGGWGSDAAITAADAINGHNNLQPYFVVLTLIKL